MTDPFKPLIIVSSERSGSNLLRKIITQNQNEYLGAEPAHFLKHLYYECLLYENNLTPKNIKKLIGYFIDLTKIHFSPWSIKYEVDYLFNKFIKTQLPFNAINFANFFYSQYAGDKGYSTYICKDNNMFDFLFQLGNNNYKFIFLYRDPRDYVLSQLKRPLQTDSIHKLAKLWKVEQLKSFQLFQKPFLKNSYFISYETLIQNEDEEIDKILEFLEVKKTKNLEFEPGNTRIHEWQNLSKQTMKNNFNKYKGQLSPSQIQIIEYHCGEIMNILGYKKEYQKIKRYSSFNIRFEEIVGHSKYLIRKIFITVTKKENFKGNLLRSKLIRKFSHV